MDGARGLMTQHTSLSQPSSFATASPFDLQRDFSSMNTMSSANDDGGPVSAPSINLKEMSNDELADMSTIPGWNLVHNPPRRNNPRGALVGKVVSDKMDKTVNVAVDRYRIVPKYRKRLRYTKKFMAHDEHEVCNMGDLVMIVPCQKISRHKHFMVREIIRPKGQL
jgi:small subunit ribosomal protein S17